MESHGGGVSSGKPPPDGRRGAKNAAASHSQAGGREKHAAEVKRPRDHHLPSAAAASSAASTAAPPPCGACKFLRRKCVGGCVFAPYFGTEQGSARFAAVHKVFGASNVSKLLLHAPAGRRHDAVVTICYEAQARLSDPVYGCVSTVLALQQQVASLQVELSMVQAQLISSRLATTSALQQQQQHIMALQPSYSTNSSASTNLVSLCNLPSSSSFDFADATALPPLKLSRWQPPRDENDDEEDSRNPMVAASAFIDGVFSPK